MTHRIVILGGGTGGTLTANRLRRTYSTAEAEIVVVDQDDRHVYQPGLLFVPFGLTHVDDIVKPRGRQLHDGITYVQSAIDRVDVAGADLEPRLEAVGETDETVAHVILSRYFEVLGEDGVGSGGLGAIEGLLDLESSG